MFDSHGIAIIEKPANDDVCDAVAIACIPQLVEKMEETAYALVRRGEAEAGRMLFLAVAATEKSEVT